jgi:hypothetical protein
MNKQRGFSIVELILLIIWLCAVGIGLTLIYWVIQALMKYVGA